MRRNDDTLEELCTPSVLPELKRVLSDSHLHSACNLSFWNTTNIEKYSHDAVMRKWNIPLNLMRDVENVLSYISSLVDEKGLRFVDTILQGRARREILKPGNVFAGNRLKKFDEPITSCKFLYGVIDDNNQVFAIATPTSVRSDLASKQRDEYGGKRWYEQSFSIIRSHALYDNSPINSI